MEATQFVQNERLSIRNTQEEASMVVLSMDQMYLYFM